MRQITLLALALLLSPCAKGADSLDRGSRFASVDEFMSELKAFAPSQQNNWLAYQFSATEGGQPEDPATGTIVRPAKIESCLVISKNDDRVVVFATARPATTATPSEVGMLFLLRRVEQKWRIAACKRFEAFGKYASVDCRLTCDDYSGLPRGPIVTITESQGGRGNSCEVSATFCVSDGITRVELE